MSLIELLVVAIVGLLVIGPERLPQAIKSGMIWIGRIKRTLNDTRTEFEQQLGMDDIRREIHNEQVLESLKALKIAKEQLEQEKEALKNPLSQVLPDPGNEDEGLFGEQKSNHPVSESEQAQPEQSSSEQSSSKKTSSKQQAKTAPAPQNNKAES